MWTCCYQNTSHARPLGGAQSVGHVILSPNFRFTTGLSCGSAQAKIKAKHILDLGVERFPLAQDGELYFSLIVAFFCKSKTSFLSAAASHFLQIWLRQYSHKLNGKTATGNASYYFNSNFTNQIDILHGVFYGNILISY